MSLDGIRDDSIEFLNTLCLDKELEVLLPEQLVLLELATCAVVQVHDPSLDAIVVPEITFDITLGHGLLPLVLQSLKLSFILDRRQEEVDRGILAL